MGIKDYIVFDGVDSREYGVYVVSQEVDTGAKRVYNEIVVPGRNGTLMIDMNYYSNVRQIYNCIAIDHAQRRIEEFRTFLSSRIGYKRLEDNVHPDEFYLASVDNEIVPSFTKERKMAKFNLEFIRKPQRFLVIGEQPIEATENFIIDNPTLYSSNPLITVWGNGSIMIGNGNYVIKGTSETCTIDTEMQECYEGATNRNKNVTLANQEYPVLPPGKTGIQISGNITKVQITPRWYTI